MRPDDGSVTHWGQPETWCLAFYRKTKWPWMDKLIPGEFKHVNCFGLAKRTGVWIFLDTKIHRTDLYTCWDNEDMPRVLEIWTRGCDVIEVAAGGGGFSWASRLGLWCVPMVAHVTGIKAGAVFPSGLHRHCLKTGGRMIQNASARPAAEQGVGSSAEGGGALQYRLHADGSRTAD